jgi:hypothetical protein
MLQLRERSLYCGDREVDSDFQRFRPNYDRAELDGDYNS